MSVDHPKRRRATLVDVAHAAGVSRATASLVVRNSPLVGSATRERVQLAMQELGYVRNLGAAGLRFEKSHTVGVIVPNLTNPFFGELLAGIEETIDATGRVVLLANSGENLERQDIFIRRMCEHGIEGIIACFAAGSDPEILKRAKAWNLPIVQTLRHISEDVDYAGTDYAGGVEQAVDYLASLGHRRIVFIARTPFHSAYSERVDGFRSAMRRHGLDAENIVQVPPELGEVAQAARLLFDAPHPPTAAICFNDVIAFGLSGGISDLGMSIGRDFSIVGFDDVAEADAVRPRLTSVSISPVRIGRAAARLLLERLDNPDRPAQRHIVEPVLVVRQSCGASPVISGEGTR